MPVEFQFMDEQGHAIPLAGVEKVCAEFENDRTEWPRAYDVLEWVAIGNHGKTAKEMVISFKRDGNEKFADLVQFLIERLKLASFRSVRF
jgi:hypothetical protein